MTVNGVQETPPNVTPGGLQITGSGASTLGRAPQRHECRRDACDGRPGLPGLHDRRIDRTGAASVRVVCGDAGLELSGSCMGVHRPAIGRAGPSDGARSSPCGSSDSLPCRRRERRHVCPQLDRVRCAAELGTGHVVDLRRPQRRDVSRGDGNGQPRGPARAPCLEHLAIRNHGARAEPHRRRDGARATSVNDANLTWAGRYVDADGDGYGAEPMVFTAPGDDLVSIGGDCDDSDPTVVPGTAACCAQPTDCDDGDPCTEDVCTAGACSHSPTCSADAEPDAGAADSDPGTPPAEPTEAVASSDGCGCRVAGVPSPASSSLLALGLAGLVGLARIGARRRDGRP